MKLIKNNYIHYQKKDQNEKKKLLTQTITFIG